MKSKSDIQSLADISRFQAAHIQDKTAFIFEDTPITYQQFDMRTSQLANGLTSLGIGQNDRVCYIGKNSIAYFELLIGASKIGAVTCPINWRLAEAEIEYVISNARSRIIFAGPEFLQTAISIQSRLMRDLTVISLDEYSTWRDAFNIIDTGFNSDPDDDVLQLYTSGTTGRPKGVRMSNRAILSNRVRELHPDSPEWNKWSSNDVGLISMPCFHIGGTGFGLTCLYAGATGVIMPNFDTTKQIDVMVKYNISKQFIVPSALQIMLNDPRINEIDFSALRHIQYGASPIPIPLMKTCMEVFGCSFVQKYGMTETCGSCVALGPEDHTIPENHRMKSVGKPLVGVEIRIVDTAGKDLPTGKTGEIIIRTPSNMTGYWENDKATENAFFEGDWLRTGDAGYLDTDGYLYIQDRIKDMIVSGGENVYSAEVEQALLENPVIHQAAVIGVPHEKWGGVGIGICRFERRKKCFRR